MGLTLKGQKCRRLASNFDSVVIFGRLINKTKFFYHRQQTIEYFINFDLKHDGSVYLKYQEWIIMHAFDETTLVLHTICIKGPLSQFFVLDFPHAT